MDAAHHKQEGTRHKIMNKNNDIAPELTKIKHTAARV